MAGHKAPAKSLPSSRFEKQAARLGARRIAGIDEAGRGPLAGPVVAAAVVLCNPDCLPHLNDSKLLPPDARSRLYDEILANAAATGIGIISPETIDQINILQATRLAMSRAVMEISPPPDYLLIDGTISLELSISQQAIIKGDRLCFSVAAAGILAKVTRDRIMMELHEQFPQYGFAQHKGYGTRAHKEAIVKYGPSPVHRLCFRGVKEPELPLFDAELFEED
jgi:ribonuclease HII